MSQDQLKAFLERAKVDTSIQEKLKAAKDIETAVEIARSAGFEITSDEIINSSDHEELSKTELESLAGGGGTGYLNSQGGYQCAGTARFCTYGNCN